MWTRFCSLVGVRWRVFLATWPRSSAEIEWAGLPGIREFKKRGADHTVKGNLERIQTHWKPRGTCKLFFLGSNPLIYHQTLVKFISYKHLFQLCWIKRTQVPALGRGCLEWAAGTRGNERRFVPVRAAESSCQQWASTGHTGGGVGGSVDRLNPLQGH